MTTSSIIQIKRSIYENSDGTQNDKDGGLIALLVINLVFIIAHIIPSFFRLSSNTRIIFIVILSIFAIIQASLCKMILDNDAIFNENLKNNNIKLINGYGEYNNPPNPKHYGTAILIFLVINIILIMIHIILIFTYKPIPKKLKGEEYYGFPQEIQ